MISVKMIGRRAAFIFLAIFLASFVSSASDLSADNLFLKVSVFSGGSINKPLTVSSVLGGDITLETIGISGVSLSNGSFYLKPGENKLILVNFDSSGLKPGIYAGGIKIKGSGSEFILPAAFEIESGDVFFDLTIDIPADYVEIIPGKEINADINLFDLTDGEISNVFGPASVDMAYYIYKSDGSLISLEKESVIVDKEKQFSRTFVIPEDAGQGDYILAGEVRYKDSTGISSRLISVKADLFSSFYLFILPVILIFAAILAAVIYDRKKRRNLAKKLKSCSLASLKKQKKLLLAKKKIRKLKREEAEMLSDIESLEKMITKKQIEEL